MERLTLAFGLIFLLVAFGAGIVAYKMYNSRARSNRRRGLRDSATYDRRMAEKAAEQANERP